MEQPELSVTSVADVSYRPGSEPARNPDGDSTVTDNHCEEAEEERPMPSQKSVVTNVTMMLCLVTAIVPISHVGASEHLVADRLDERGRITPATFLPG